MDTPQSQTPHPENEFPLLDYLIVLAKNARLIIKVTVIVTVLTYLILLLFVPKKYTAVTAILPPQQNMTLSGQLLQSLGGGTTPGEAPGLAGMASNLMGIRTSGDVYVGMLTSNTILDRIINQFNLRQIYKGKYIETVRLTLKRYSQINFDRKTGLITIEVTDIKPQRAAAMANAFVEDLDQLLQKMVVNEAKERLAFLEKERLKVNGNLSTAEKNLRTFMEKNNVVQIDAQAKGMLEYIAQLRAQVDAKEVQIKVASQTATILNPDVSRLETELKGLKEKLSVAENQYDPSCVGDVCLAATKMPALGLEYLNLFREAKFQEALSQLYAKMVELARLDMARNVNVINVVDRGIPPEKKSNPRMLPTMLAGGGAFVFMIFFSFFRENYYEAKKREDVARRLAILNEHCQPLLGFWAKLRGLMKFRRWPRPNRK